MTLLFILLGVVIVLQLLQVFIGKGSGTDGFSHQDRIDLFHIRRDVQHMTQNLNRLHAAVSAQSTVIASVQTLLGQLSQRIRDANASDDTEELDAIASELENNSAELSRAVLANTPAEAGELAGDGGAVAGGDVGGATQPTDETNDASGNATNGADVGTEAPSGGEADVAQPTPPSE